MSTQAPSIRPGSVVGRQHLRQAADDLGRPGVLTISLDFELAWGTRGRPNARFAKPFLDGTRAAVQGLLDLFQRYEVSATWATVGALFLGDPRCGEREQWLSPDEFSDVPCGDSQTEPHWFAEDILPAILNCDVSQEFACHTMTHWFVDPTPAGRERFRWELQTFRRLCSTLDLPQPTTFIFPKARMGHFDVLREEGFLCYRGPESGWFETLPGQLLPAGLRLLDARWAARPHVGFPKYDQHGLSVIPSSQFYSPFLGVGKHVSVRQRVDKAIRGLHRAATRGGVYHLWTHPFNLGVRTDELLGGLDVILREARKLTDQGQLQIASMGKLCTAAAGQ